MQKLQSLLRRILPLFLLLFTLTSPLGAQVGTVGNVRSLGDMAIALSAGFFIPLFIHNPNIPLGEGALGPTKLSLGASLAISGGVYINDNIQLGMEAGVSFSDSINEHNYVAYPIFLKGSYEFHFLKGRLYLPLYLGLGIQMSSYQSNFNLDTLVKPGLGLHWQFLENWAVGMDLMYWWVPQVNIDDSYYTRIAGFMDLSVAVTYHGGS